MADWHEVRSQKKIEGLKDKSLVVERLGWETNFILNSALEHANGNVDEAKSC